MERLIDESVVVVNTYSILFVAFCESRRERKECRHANAALSAAQIPFASILRRRYVGRVDDPIVPFHTRPGNVSDDALGSGRCFGGMVVSSLADVGSRAVVNSLRASIRAWRWVRVVSRSHDSLSQGIGNPNAF